MSKSDKACSCGCGDTPETCKCPATCSCKKPGGSCYVEKSAALGLWDRIRAKRERGGTPAKPGDKDYPDSKSWKKVTGLAKKEAGAPMADYEQELAKQHGSPSHNSWLEMTGKFEDAAEAGEHDFNDHKAQAALVAKHKASLKKEAGTPAWQRAEGKNDEGGLNAKGRASYNKATGGNLKPPVTESNPKGDRAKRQNSFCARMCGMKKHETGSKTKKDPDSRINKSLRKWNCKCSSALEFAEKLALAADLGQKSMLNVTNSFNDRSQAAALLGALLPTAVGGVAGALSSRKGKRLAGAARGAGIGAAYTAGAHAGNALGGLASGGNSLARLGGGLGGGVGGALLAANLLPEIEEEKQSMNTPNNLYTFGAKLAQSACMPCDMPNGPANKKHTTGASPAVLEADEKSEELGRPETEETEHSEQAIDIPGKAAAFGRKLAANYGGVWQNPNQFDSANKDLQLVNPATGFSQDTQMTFPYEGPTPVSIAKNVLGFLNRQRLAAGTAIGDAVGSLYGAPVSAWTGPSSPKPAAPKPVAAPTNLYDALVSVAKSDVTGKDLPAAIAQVSPPERASPSLLSQIVGSPYTPYVAGGLGATGLAALTYYLMNQKPKKKREDEKE